jgi:hypothetical protein
MHALRPVQVEVPDHGEHRGQQDQPLALHLLPGDLLVDHEPDDSDDGEDFQPGHVSAP